ncbi:murein transglycosylase [Fusarium verticillioides 7600]|uniref:lytic cellulose monooxygenase (C4-dehydrogenating) n=1 Tax=Gibberella moniliformis (strain M3125 / FGSC 7600) TaxID=334819 RepID=W7MNS0_GIBM7|nr:murein transglycosylase [Fusarium verticillioides 7600]EWG49240.1 murein transglycosylase [Fusarium verticillioides 7600]
MKFSALAFAALSQVASAHYFFDVSALNGAESKSFQYIRDFTRPTKYNPIKFSSNPSADIRDNSFADGEDIICNQGATGTGGQTEVLEVKGGDVMTFKLAVGAKMGHPGPTLAYMSNAGGDVKSYKGDGDWFKIMEEGVCNTGGDFTKDAWCNYDAASFDVKIPQGTPNGEYLLRVEHIGVHRSHVNQPEHYVSCAQVKVTGGSDGTVDAEMVKFPGAYKDTDGYANFSIYNGAKPFPMPGPKVWDGSASAGGSTGGNTGNTGGSTETPAAGNTEAPASTPAPEAGNGQQNGGEQAQPQTGNNGQNNGQNGGFNQQFQGQAGSSSSPCHA